MGVGHSDQPRAVMASQVSGAGGAGGQRDRGMMWARAQRSIAASLFTADAYTFILVPIAGFPQASVEP